MAYSTKADLENLFGKMNIKTWADLDNLEDPETIQQRVAWAIALADERIDDRLRDSQYQLPLSPVSVTVVDISARLAAVRLYESRGVSDAEDSRLSQMAAAEQRAESTLNDILAGRILITATKQSPKTYPSVETFDDD